MKNETWVCPQINLHVCITRPSMRFCAPGLHALREPGDALQTGGDDVTRIDCDQACLVLTQVCHQMTDDDRRWQTICCQQLLDAADITKVIWSPCTPQRPSHSSVVQRNTRFPCKPWGRGFVFPLQCFFDFFFFLQQQVLCRNTQMQSQFLFMSPIPQLDLQFKLDTKKKINALRGESHVFLLLINSEF